MCLKECSRQAEMLTSVSPCIWDNFLGALVGYNRRFAFGGDTPADLRSDLAAGREREMPEVWRCKLQR